MTKQRKTTVDIRVGGGNGFYTITPVSKAGRAWIEENVQYEGWQCLGPSIGIDNGQLAHDIACGAQAAGLEVE